MRSSNVQYILSKAVAPFGLFQAQKTTLPTPAMVALPCIADSGEKAIGSPDLPDVTSPVMRSSSSCANPGMPPAADLRSRPSSNRLKFPEDIALLLPDGHRLTWRRALFRVWSRRSALAIRVLVTGPCEANIVNCPGKVTEEIALCQRRNVPPCYQQGKTGSPSINT